MPNLLPRPRKATFGRRRCLVDDVRVAPASDLAAEGYRLRVDGDGVRVDAADAAGEFHARRTLAYEGHEDVWRDASPFTADEVTELDDYCAARHVTLTPNQNCLGHMDRWLRWPRYRSLGLSEEPILLGGIVRRPPMTMDPAD